MIAVFISVIGIALFETRFPKMTIAGIPIIYLVMACLMISYIRFFVVKRGTFSLSKGEKSLMLFVLFGLFIAGLSALDLNRAVVSDDLYLMRSYIPRQAYYLFILPAIVLFQDDFYTKYIDEKLKKYWKLLFWMIYFLQFILLKSIIVSLSAGILLCWLFLKNKGAGISKRYSLYYLVLLFTPVSGGGASTQLIIRTIFILIILFQERWKRKLFKRLSIGLVIMIIATFILPFFSDLLGSMDDVNASWRLQYWKDELEQLSSSHFLGVGYGTSYASVNFVGRSLHIIGGPFGATEGYSTLEKMFVTGSHSSFIAVAFRLGLIGIVLFSVFLIRLNKDLQLSKHIVSPSTCFAFCSAIVLIDFNVGLESPSYLICFVYYMGRCIQESKSLLNSTGQNSDEVEEKGRRLNFGGIYHEHT